MISSRYQIVKPPAIGVASASIIQRPCPNDFLHTQNIPDVSSNTQFQIMDFIKELGKIQRYVSIVCRYPLFGIDSDDLDDKEMVASHKARRTIPLHSRLIPSIVVWEFATLKKRDDFIVPKNNFYHPPHQERGEATGLDFQDGAMTGTSITNANDNSILYKYLSPVITLLTSI